MEKSLITSGPELLKGILLEVYMVMVLPKIWHSADVLFFFFSEKKR